MLEPVRQYAAERSQLSGFATVTADRHADHFHGVATAARETLHGPSVVATIDRLEADHANLRSAYLRLLETDRSDEAAELVGSVWLYLGLRGHAREGLSWLDRLGAGASRRGSCLALTGRAGLLFVTGEIAPMREDDEGAVLGWRVGSSTTALRSERRRSWPATRPCSPGTRTRPPGCWATRGSAARSPATRGPTPTPGAARASWP